MILAIHLTLYAFGVSISDSGSFGDTIAGFLAPYIGALTIYFVYRAYQKQHDSHDLQERSVNFQALNQLLQDLELKRPTVIITIQLLWKDVYSYNNIIKTQIFTNSLNPLTGYFKHEAEIKSLISFFNEMIFVSEKSITLSLGRDFSDIIKFKLHSLKESLILIEDLKFVVSIDHSSKIEELGEIDIEKRYMPQEEYKLLETRLKNAIISISHI